jgi:hypothetical protein
VFPAEVKVVGLKQNVILTYAEIPITRSFPETFAMDTPGKLA